MEVNWLGWCQKKNKKLKKHPVEPDSEPELSAQGYSGIRHSSPLGQMMDGAVIDGEASEKSKGAI